MWVNMVQDDYPKIMCEEREWYLFQRLNTVPYCIVMIQTTPPLGHLVLTSALEPLLVATMTGVAESLKSLIFKITIGTDCKLVNLLDMEYANLTHDDQNSRFDKPEI